MSATSWAVNGTYTFLAAFRGTRTGIPAARICCRCASSRSSASWRNDHTVPYASRTTPHEGPGAWVRASLPGGRRVPAGDPKRAETRDPWTCGDRSCSPNGCSRNDGGQRGFRGSLRRSQIRQPYAAPFRLHAGQSGGAAPGSLAHRRARSAHASRTRKLPGEGRRGRGCSRAGKVNASIPAVDLFAMVLSLTDSWLSRSGKTRSSPNAARSSTGASTCRAASRSTGPSRSRTLNSTKSALVSERMVSNISC